MTLTEITDELSAARTNKRDFLNKLETIIPWEEFMEIIQPSYYKVELGNKAIPARIDAANLHITECVRSCRYGSDERRDRQPCIFKFPYQADLYASVTHCSRMVLCIDFPRYLGFAGIDKYLMKLENMNEKIVAFSIVILLISICLYFYKNNIFTAIRNIFSKIKMGV